MVKETDKLRHMLLVFIFLSVQRSISPDMAIQFIEGLGWDTLRKWIQKVFSIDALAACRDVLQVKCRFELQALRKHCIDFTDPELWRCSLFRPVGEVQGGQKQLQTHHFKDALRLLEEGYG
jgi:hypothetical protein